MRGLSADLPDLEALSAEEVLVDVAERYAPRLLIACSFQKEASVIMDMAVRADLDVRFFTLDTGVLFGETYDVWRRLEEHYGITVERRAGITLEEQAATYGDELWNRDPDRCCDLRKVTPLRDVLAEGNAWIAGLRRDQSPSRAETPKLGWDTKHGLPKVAPLASWTDRDVWRYLYENDVPYHPLHDEGFASIGCTHCTVPANGREGRWAQDAAKLECGIHA